MSDDFVKLIVSFFHIGNVPKAPGTAASLAGALIYLILQPLFLIHIFLFAIITAMGFIVGEAAEKAYKKKDPPQVVIDEVAGMLLSCFLLPAKISVIFWAFVLFRLFDITKIFPIRNLEKMQGGVGIMMDDLMAGLYTNLIMHIAVALKIIV